MEFFAETLAVAVALAMDALATAIACGVSGHGVGLRRVARLAWHFGFFQAGMCALGYVLGQAVADLMASIGHWVAFGLLAAVGGHMVVAGVGDGGGKDPGSDPTRGLSLVSLSVATSLDALAVGVSFSLLGRPILAPALIIGLVALLFTAAGMLAGGFLSRFRRVNRYAPVAAGLVLVALGFKLLWAEIG